MKHIRISNKHHKRLALTRGEQSLTAKLDAILALYFESRGGELEHQNITLQAGKLLPPVNL
jgi:hypothetical protein